MASSHRSSQTVLHMFFLSLSLTLLFSAASYGATEPAASQPFNEKDYYISQSFPLDPKTEGIEGTIEILLDKTIRNIKHPDPHIHKCDAIYPYNDNSKFAYLVIRTKDNKISSTVRMDDIYALLEKNTELDPNGKPVYFCSTNLNNGNPDICGWYFNLYEVKDGIILPLKSQNTKISIQLKKTIRAYYDLVDSKNGNGKEIWAFYCDIYSANPRTMYFTRYYNDGKQWKSKTRKKNNMYWDIVDRGFPEDKYFK